MLGYGGAPFGCDTGTTGIDTDIVDLELAFFGCSLSGLASDVTCSGTARWHVLTPTTRSGSSLCGPASGVVRCEGQYELYPPLTHDSPR
jgi:hypothetical protein